MALEQGYVDGERSTYWDLVVRPQFNLNRVSIIEVKRFNFVNPSSRGGTISCPMSVLGDTAILGGRALGKASSASSNHSLVRDDAALGGMPFAMILSGGPGEGSSMK